MGMDLFEGSDGDADLSKIEINHEFARRLEHNKRREALQRLQDLKQRGLAPSSSSDDSSSSSDDDDDGDDEDLAGSRKLDIQFYDALLKAKRQDPVLQHKDAKLFSSDDDDDEDEEAAKKPRGSKKEKPLYLKDIMAQHLIEEGPEFDDKPLKPNTKIYKKEQADDIRAFLEAEKAAFESGDEEDLIKEKETARNEIGDADNGGGEVQKKLDEYFGNNENLDDNEMFLKNFLMNKMWVDKEKGKQVVPDDSIDVSEDEDELDKQEMYEAKYNFRHEEAGAAEGGDRVLGHSRVIVGSVRKKESSRKVQRKSKEERMALAKNELKEELKHLKNLKKKELQEKVKLFQKTAGNGEDGACNLDFDYLEEDFDPEEHDRKMGEIFGENYYDAEDADPGFGSEDDVDLEKPDFEKEDELLGLPKDWDLGGSAEGFAAARERVLKQKEEGDELRNEEGKRKRKRKFSLKEKMELDKELEEYYKLDYEDTIGDLKTRFKYRSVPANRYGLRTEEILMAKDKDLNQYVSLKKIAPYQPNEWKVMYHQKLKKKMILQGEKSDDKRKKKKHNPKEDLCSTEQDKKAEQEELNGEEAKKESRKSKRRRRHAELKLSRSRLLAYGKISSKSSKKH